MSFYRRHKYLSTIVELHQVESKWKRKILSFQKTGKT